MTRILASLALVLALLAPIQAQTVSNSVSTTQVEIIFYVTEGTNSPYQGRLVYTLAESQALTMPQLRAAQIAQYQAWKATQIASAAQLTAQEIAQNVEAVSALGSAALITLNNSTANQNMVALRSAYQTATKLQAIMISDYLGTLTNGQLMALLSMTLQQVQSLRTNTLTPAAAIATSIRAAAGQ
jgi:hypothetical protein